MELLEMPPQPTPIATPTFMPRPFRLNQLVGSEGLQFLVEPLLLLRLESRDQSQDSTRYLTLQFLMAGREFKKSDSFQRRLAIIHLVNPLFE